MSRGQPGNLAPKTDDRMRTRDTMVDPDHTQKETVVSGCDHSSTTITYTLVVPFPFVEALRHTHDHRNLELVIT